jgi:hypothetical protein
MVGNEMMPIKSKTVWRYDSIKETTKKGFVSLVVRYDNLGNPNEETCYYPDGDIMFRNIYRYGKNNRMTGKTFYIHEKIEIIYKYFYNAENLLTLETAYNPDKSIYSKTTFLYDKNRNLVENIRFKSKDKICFTEKMIYDENNRIIEKIIDRSIYAKICYKYNKVDQIFKEIEYDQNGIIRFERHHIYDQKGKKNRVITYLPNRDILVKCINRYNGRGRLIQELEYNLFSNYLRKTLFKYNKTGNVIEQNEYRFNKFEKPGLLEKTLFEYWP